jgi:hypothetical protein
VSKTGWAIIIGDLDFVVGRQGYYKSAERERQKDKADEKNLPVHAWLKIDGVVLLMFARNAITII